MSAEYAILWPSLVQGGPALLVVKVLSRSVVAFVREHWRRFDADGMFVATEHDPSIDLGARVRFCVIGFGALRLLEGHAMVTAIRRVAGGEPGMRLCFTSLDEASRTLHEALLQHGRHVEHVGRVPRVRAPGSKPYASAEAAPSSLSSSPRSKPS